MLERLGRLPVVPRVLLAASAMALATIIDLAFVVRTSPWRPEVLVAAALGALAAWPFAWRARSRVDKVALAAAILAFAAAMLWARMTGRLVSSFAFLVSVIVLSLPVQRARGFMEPRDASDRMSPE